MCQGSVAGVISVGRTGDGAGQGLCGVLPAKPYFTTKDTKNTKASRIAAISTFPIPLIPAKAGIQVFFPQGAGTRGQKSLGPRLRGDERMIG